MVFTITCQKGVSIIHMWVWYDQFKITTCDITVFHTLPSEWSVLLNGRLHSSCHNWSYRVYILNSLHIMMENSTEIFWKIWNAKVKFYLLWEGGVQCTAIYTHTCTECLCEWIELLYIHDLLYHELVQQERILFLETIYHFELKSKEPYF
jgi:hypothetical protein